MAEAARVDELMRTGGLRDPLALVNRVIARHTSSSRAALSSDLEDRLRSYLLLQLCIITLSYRPERDRRAVATGQPDLAGYASHILPLRIEGFYEILSRETHAFTDLSVEAFEDARSARDTDAGDDQGRWLEHELPPSDPFDDVDTRLSLGLTPLP